MSSNDAAAARHKSQGLADRRKCTANAHELFKLACIVVEKQKTLTEANTAEITSQTAFLDDRTFAAAFCWLADDLIASYDALCL